MRKRIPCHVYLHGKHYTIQPRVKRVATTHNFRGEGPFGVERGLMSMKPPLPRRWPQFSFEVLRLLRHVLGQSPFNPAQHAVLFNFDIRG